MPNFEKLRRLLLDAQDMKVLVVLDRVSRSGRHVNGFVVGVGRKWVLLAQTIAGGYFDGYAAVRLREVARVRPARTFEEKFSRTLPEWPPRPPSNRPAPNLDSTSSMLASLLTPGELLSIERNKKYDALWVGVANELTRRWLYLWEVRPDASWHDQPRGYRPGSITVVRTGDHYLQALAAVAGAIPDEELRHQWTARSKALPPAVIPPATAR